MREHGQRWDGTATLNSLELMNFALALELKCGEEEMILGNGRDAEIECSSAPTRSISTGKA